MIAYRKVNILAHLRPAKTVSPLYQNMIHLRVLPEVFICANIYVQAYKITVWLFRTFISKGGDFDKVLKSDVENK